ncbi:(2Fe-2S)-binding protein [Sporosarcina siberiensis]|uniref:(2Fe-2S)-binding protein n=1 Tax=Sporosarcina siberiensis TaxID=1365606 RepID=A0ABW4SJA6_9BACL
MDKSTIICKCEEINIDEIETALKMGAQTFNDVKRLTRCGMGQCQAKICMNLVRNLIHQVSDIPLSEISPATMRMPLKMIRIEVLAGDCEPKNVVSIFEESISEEGD